MSVKVCHLALLGVMAISSEITPQPLERIVLKAPELVSAAYFTDVSSAIRLPSGAILVADPGSAELLLVEPGSARIRVLGRAGEGPGEYRAPQFVYEYERDSVVLFDARLLRLSVLNPEGQFVRTVSLGRLGTAIVPLGTDGRSQIFFRGINREKLSERAPVLRYSIPDGQIDTVTHLTTAKLVNLNPGNERTIGSQILRVVPYSDADAFSALPGGGFLVARSRTSQVEWYDRHGSRVSAMAFPATRPPMTDSLRKTVRPAQLRDMLPTSLPPFEDFGVIRSSQGRVWMRASARMNGESVWYGFSRTAPKVAVLTLPRGVRLVGVSEPMAIVSRRMDNDLQRIEVHRISP